MTRDFVALVKANRCEVRNLSDMAFCNSLILFLLVGWQATSVAQVRLAESRPEAGDDGVTLDASIQLRFSDALEPESLTHLKLLLNGSPKSEVALRRSTDLTNASITLVPQDFLEPDRRYAVVGTRNVKSADGAEVKPFRFEFRTSNMTPENHGAEFVPQTFDKTRSMTSVLFGPDRKLYAASAFGEIVRWNIDSSGRPSGRHTVFQDPKESRLYIDLEWDPEATADQLVLWASYGERLTPKDDPRYYFTGTIARLVIQEGRIADERIIVTGLPHGRARKGPHETLPHQPNGLCFHEGKLYQSVGSTSSSGGPANWGIEEQPLTACILEIDYEKIKGPLDVSPSNSKFDPKAKDSPVRRYATGVRNALEIVAHSNGRLYTAVNINDRANTKVDGVPDDPDIPGDQNALIKRITPNHESLFVLERGRHYGFPNPSIGHYVLNGGNPTEKVDPFEITDYPVGTLPEKGFAPELMFPIWRWGGTSPNGMIEYQPEFSHPLARALICCFYSANDIAVMPLGDNGFPTSVGKLRSPSGKLRFAGPLDITQDPRTGSLYVADFGLQSKFGADGSMVWLRPADRQVSSR